MMTVGGVPWSEHEIGGPFIGFMGGSRHLTNPELNAVYDRQVELL